MSVILVGLLISAWFSQGTAGTTSPPSTAGPEKAGESPPAPSPSPSAPADGLEALKGEVSALSGQIDGLGKRIDAVSKTMPVPDLSSMQAKLDDLTPLPGMVAPLPKTVEELNARVGTIDEALVALKAEVASIQKEVERRPDPATTSKSDTPAEPRDAIRVALESGATLFREQKYPLALETFGKLQKSYPDDARVWYYSALTNGLNTGKWDGTSVELVKEGVAREKAGNPDSAQIDSEFAGLTKATGKEWLAFYRKQARP